MRVWEQLLLRTVWGSPTAMGDHAHPVLPAHTHPEVELPVKRATA